jgi:hypothetical protein
LYLEADLDGYVARSEDHRKLLLKALKGRVTNEEVDEPLVVANLWGVDSKATESKTELDQFLQVLSTEETATRIACGCPETFLKMAKVEPGTYH